MKYKKILVSTLAVAGLFLLSGCQEVGMTSKAIQEKIDGVSMTVKTYDENSQVIDTVTGKSMMIDRDARFDSTDSNGTGLMSNI